MKFKASLLCCLFATSFSYGALTVGSIGFVGFNVDGDDDFAFVAVSTIAENETIFFTDDEWNGTAFNTGEGFLEWTAPAGGVAAGEIVTIQGGPVTTDVGSVSSVGGSFNLAATGDQIFAYQATAFNSTPSVFLTALTTNGNGSNDLTLTGTGLTLGTNALDVTITHGDGEDGGYYSGSRSSQSSFADYLTLINDSANWTVEGSDGTLAVPNFAGSFTLIPEPSATLLGGLGLLALLRRRR